MQNSKEARSSIDIKFYNLVFPLLFSLEKVLNMHAKNLTQSYSLHWVFLKLQNNAKC